MYNTGKASGWFFRHEMSDLFWLYIVTEGECSRIELAHTLISFIKLNYCPVVEICYSYSTVVRDLWQ